jgi:hypothetical protein
MKRELLSLFFLLGVVFTSHSQHAILDNMLVQQEGEVVFISWTISSGETCIGIRIERSVNGNFFEQIGYIDGECGNPGFAVSYNFTDNSPSANTVNSYRLDLGGRGYTDVVDLFYVNTSGVGYFLSSNPIQPDTRLYISNTRGELWLLEVFDIGGRLINRTITQSNSFLLRPSDFKSGLYVFTVSNGTQIYSGKLVVI